MEATVKQRLIEYLKFKRIGQNRFEKKAGLSIGYISKLRIEPSPTKLRDIINAAPDLNKEWLLTGEGEMLLPKDGNVATVVGDGTAVAGNSNHVEMPTIISKALDEISAQRMLTQKAQEQLDKAYDQGTRANRSSHHTIGKATSII